MPAIPLPGLSSESEKIVKRPPAPSNPPTVKDITNSFHFSQDLLNAHARKQAGDQEVVNAEIYKNKLLSTHEGNEPAWFAGAINRVKDDMVDAMGRILDERLAPIRTDIQSIRNDVQTLKNDVRTLKDNLQDLKEEQSHVRRIAAMTYNISTGTGDEAGFAVVPFVNGQDPTKEPHNLPPLHCAKDVRELDAGYRDQYYKGYYPPDDIQNRLPRISERIEKIFLAIGAKNY